MTLDIAATRHPKENRYGRATLVIGVLLWLAMGVVVLWGSDRWRTLAIFVVYGAVLWGVSAAIRALTRAHILGHYVLVGPAQFPRIEQMVRDGTATLGLSEPPATFVYNSHGVMNAFALRLVGKTRYVWLASTLIDADNEEQLRFVIGHELGHHVAGHLDTIPHLVRLPAMAVPFLGAAYSRARELTCDRIGASLVRDVGISQSALQMLACGSAKLNDQMNGAAFAAQEALVPPIAGFVLKAFSGYPRLTKRVEEVAAWLRSPAAGLA